MMVACMKRMITIPTYEATTKLPRLMTSLTFEVATTRAISASTP